MDITWYQAVIDGRTQDLLKLMENTPNRDIVWRDATPLHVALRRGNVELAQEIAWRHQQLVTQRDTSGETPLHCALVVGHNSFLLWCLNPTANDLERGRVLNTEAIASDSLLDSAGRSLLYLAVERGTPELVQALLMSPLGSTSGGPNQLTALHAAVFRYENSDDRMAAREIIQALMNDQRQLSRETDVSGNTPLHYAATLRNLDLLDLLLSSDISAAYIQNKEGLSPVHVVASLGRVDMFKRFVESCPNSGFMTTASGSNVLHVSVQAGQKDMVRHILASSELSILMNGKDGDGNTPLHLSLLLPDERIRQLLMKNNMLDTKAWNNEGLTFADMELIKSTLQSVVANLAGVRRSRRLYGFAGMKYMRIKEKVNTLGDAGADSRKDRMERITSSTNALMLVATLIVTVTFTAALTIPGGYNDREPDKGMATLARSAALKAFLISDTLSLFFSIVALYRLVAGALLSGSILMPTAISPSAQLIHMAVVSMFVAFGTGIYSVMEAHSRPTAIAILAITSIAPFYYFCDLLFWSDLVRLPLPTQFQFFSDLVPTRFQHFSKYIEEYTRRDTMFDQGLAELILKPQWDDHSNTQNLQDKALINMDLLAA